MDPITKIMAIQGAYEAKEKKEVAVRAIRQDFEAHFDETPGYEPDVMINGVRQPLIVYKDGKVLTERKIISRPPQTFELGDVVDCYSAKWLITEIDENKQFYTLGKMEECNMEIRWQNPDTKQLISRWCTVDKPYFSNLEENKVIGISTREYKIKLSYDAETSLLDVGKRFMLEIIAGNPKTYRITSVDTMTERYVVDGDTKGFLILNVEQDQTIHEKDRSDLMIADYIEPDAPPPSSISCKIYAVGGLQPTLVCGGGEKSFEASLCNVDGSCMPLDTCEWIVSMLPEQEGFISSTIHNATITLRCSFHKPLIGTSILLRAIAPNGASGDQYVKVVSSY